MATIGGWEQGVKEYHEQVRLERGEKCPVCSGTGYLKQALGYGDDWRVEESDEPIYQHKLWK